MSYLAYPFAVLASLIITLFCFVVGNWVVVLFADDAGNLPRWCRWFQTFDATLDEGMLARRRELAAGVGNAWAAFDPYPKTWLERYLNRVRWLMRNPAYGFDYYLLGLAWRPDEWRVVRYESTPERDLFIACGNGFNIYSQGPWGTYKLGWKAWNHFDPATGRFSRSWGDDTRIPICFTCNPFRRKTD